MAVAESLPVDANDSFLRIDRIRELLSDHEAYYAGREERIRQFLDCLSKTNELTFEVVGVVVEGYDNVQDESGDWSHVKNGQQYRSHAGYKYHDAYPLLWEDDCQIAVNRLRQRAEEATDPEAITLCDRIQQMIKELLETQADKNN